MKKNSHNEYIIYENPEKEPPYRLGKGEYMPFNTTRLLMSALPGSGKRSLALNLIFEMDPKPKKIMIVHHDTDTIEYDILGNIGCPIEFYDVSNFPTKENLIIDDSEESDSEKSDSEKSHDMEQLHDSTANGYVLIIDEITADSLDKTNRARFERAINWMATHMNVFIICSIQSLMSIPVKARRGFSMFAIWKQNDDMLNTLTAQKAGVSVDMLKSMFSLLHTRYEFITVDTMRSADDPFRFAFCLKSPIIISEVPPAEK